MASLLDFVSRVRTLLDQPETGAIVVLGTEPDDERRCVLATALGVPVGGGESPEWADPGR